MFVKQKTAYEMRIIDWSSDVCSSDLGSLESLRSRSDAVLYGEALVRAHAQLRRIALVIGRGVAVGCRHGIGDGQRALAYRLRVGPRAGEQVAPVMLHVQQRGDFVEKALRLHRSEEHTSELQSLMRISYAVFCLKKKKTKAE